MGRNALGLASTWKVDAMLTWALIFLLVAVVAGLFGFWGVASVATGFARVLFVVFLVLFLGSLLVNMIGRA
jgi:uncharacterized membrane protein YtjA (UPF0391 family)